MESSPAGWDVIVAGSGISGAMAAWELVNYGLRVAMLDVGVDDDAMRALIPDRPFSELRREDKNQKTYFLGRNHEGVPRRGIRVGAQLTPPRQYIHRNAETWLPFAGDDFRPLQSVSLGGLGAGWGAACFTFNQQEIGQIGIDDPNFPDYYQRAADVAGISADPESEINTHLWRGVERHQPPLEIDSNAESILRTYARRKAALRARGFQLGRIPLAILSQDLPPRRANPYFDMDFYSDARMSVYRPRYLVEQLKKSPRFTYKPSRLVVRFEDRADGVDVHCRNLETGGVETTSGQRLVLCTGALNSARIALNSLGLAEVKTPLLCNPYTYMPTVNLAMLGRTVQDRRYSLAQIGGVLESQDGAEIGGAFQMYSYRSLLLFKLVKEMPLPVRQGLLVGRSLVNALAIFGIFFADEQSETKYLRILETAESAVPELHAQYELSQNQRERKRIYEKRFASALKTLRCVPIGKVDPGKAGSIHYAGTIPFENPLSPRFHSHSDYRLEGTRHVYVGDSASWKFLPAKGLSFTLMANALRAAQHVAKSL